MKKNFENIIRGIKDLNSNKQEFIISQLKELNKYISELLSKNDSFKRQLAGVNPKQFNDTLIKSVELLKIFGFNENTFEMFSTDFLNWFIENTTTNIKFNPKLMNFHLLESLQQAYFISYAENEGIKPTYQQVKKTLLTFDETIKQYENELNISLPELLNRIDGKN